MASLEGITVYPIKSLDGTAVERATIVENGGLEWDRRYAIVDADGEYVNGKRERAIHALTANYDLSTESVTIGVVDEETEATFHLESDHDAFEAWLSTYVGYDVSLVRADDGGYPDDTDASGPTLISEATLETVASWYEGIDAAEMRRRLRPNLVVADTEVFWEDRLYDRPGTIVPFEIGGATIHGVNPCQRCVVPSRDPATGVETPDFRSTFVKRREETLPEWAGREWFDHYFRLMVNTRVPPSSWGTTLTVGDQVSVSDPVEATIQ